LFPRTKYVTVTESCKTKMRTGLSKNMLMGAAIVATGAVQMKEGIGQGRVARTNESGLHARVADGGNTFLQQKSGNDIDTDPGVLETDTEAGKTDIGSAQANDKLEVDAKGSTEQLHGGSKDENALPGDKGEEAGTDENLNHLEVKGQPKMKPQGVSGHGESDSVIRGTSGETEEHGAGEVEDQGSMQGVKGDGDFLDEDSARHKEGSSGPATGEVGDQDSMEGLLGETDYFFSSSASYEDESSGPATGTPQEFQPNSVK